MLNALNSAATGMMAQQKQVETISNNLANADTVGFKRSRTDFQDLIYQNQVDPGAATSATTQNPTGVQIGSGAKVAGTARDHSHGAPRVTNRELDVAITGSGFLAYQKPNGEIAYSRDGSLRLGAEGRLENIDGLPLQPEIVVPANTQSIEISPDGRVSVRLASNDVQELGQIQVTTFANPSGLQAMGGNMYEVSPASGAPVPVNPGEQGSGQLMQRFLESPSVCTNSTPKSSRRPTR
jgi:flagellar basal-body rod protein FlgG